jgi:hypothetical protein
MIFLKIAKVLFKPENEKEVKKEYLWWFLSDFKASNK